MANDDDPKEITEEEYKEALRGLGLVKTNHHTDRYEIWQSRLDLTPYSVKKPGLMTAAERYLEIEKLKKLHGIAPRMN